MVAVKTPNACDFIPISVDSFVSISNDPQLEK